MQMPTPQQLAQKMFEMQMQKKHGGATSPLQQLLMPSMGPPHGMPMGGMGLMGLGQK